MFSQAMASCQSELLASVYDPITARMAKDLGFRFGMIGGSVVSASLIGAPDFGVLTQSELVHFVQRIRAASDLPLIVDGDAGYGGSRHVIRLIQALENAGANAVTLEDTDLHQSQMQRKTILCNPTQHCERLHHALIARQSAAFGIIARTQWLEGETFEAFLQRVRLYAQQGVDAICLFDLNKPDVIPAIRMAADVPLMLINYSITSSDVTHWPTELILSGHSPFQSSVSAAFQALCHLKGQDHSVSAKELLSRYCL
jgi:carboxyvinyl-carboxyphosphonate phosphorylmutase